MLGGEVHKDLKMLLGDQLFIRLRMGDADKINKGEKLQEHRSGRNIELSGDTMERESYTTSLAYKMSIE